MTEPGPVSIPSGAGIPRASLDATVDILRASPGRRRRRELLETLGSSGHSISLAGLNRILDHLLRLGLISQTAEGVAWIRPPEKPSTRA